MSFAIVPWNPAADPGAVCAAAGETDPSQRMIDNGRLWIYGATQEAADAALATHPPHVSSAAAQQALVTLQQLDTDLPRCVEDLIAATGIAVSSLPSVMQQRLAAKATARAIYKAG